MKEKINKVLVKEIIGILFVTSFEMLKTFKFKNRTKKLFLCFDSMMIELEYEISDDYKEQVLEKSCIKSDRRKFQDYHF
jgi:hypothetical protein